MVSGGEECGPRGPVENAWLRADDATFTGQFTAAENAVRLFSRTGRQLRLIWIDTPSAAPHTSSI